MRFAETTRLSVIMRAAVDGRARPGRPRVEDEQPGSAVDWLTTSTILRDLRDYANEGAWTRFVERFRRPVVRFARQTGLDAAAAEDVAQEALLAFAAAFRAGKYDRDKGRLSRWLFGIAYNHVLRQRQKDAREGARLADVGGSAFWGEVPDERTAGRTWDEEWENALWCECLERVRPEFEPQSIRAFELVLRDGRSAAEAADELGIPVKAVYNAKHRVLKRLRQLRAELEDSA